jgi:hypothetical protein
MVGYRPPRFLTGKTNRPQDVAGFWWHLFGTPDAALKIGAQSVASPGFDTVVFAQLIAKIAHAYAVAVVGQANFVPMLRPFILREFERAEQYPACFRLIGGVPSLHAPSDALHVLGLGYTETRGRTFLVAMVRLFANLGAPTYTAVVGELTNLDGCIPKSLI